MRLSTSIIALTVATSVGAVSVPTVHAQAVNNTHTPKAKTVQQDKTYRVIQPGDTLSKIAKNFGSTYQRLYDANTFINDPDLIYPGDKVRIPSASEQLAHRQLPSDAPKAVAQSAQPVATPQPAPAPAPAPQPVVHASYAAPAVAPVSTSGGSAWDRLADCESGGNWSINTGNGFYGGLQFTLSSWRAVGGQGLPSNASKAEQIARAQMLQARQGWGAWPVCSIQAGLR